MVEVVEKEVFLLKSVSDPYMGEQDPDARLTPQLIKISCIACLINSAIHPNSNGPRIYVIKI
jgi:hypothetical protein